MGRLNILLNLYCLLELESQFAYSGVFLPLPNSSSSLVCKAIFCSCSDPTKEQEIVKHVLVLAGQKVILPPILSCVSLGNKLSSGSRYLNCQCVTDSESSCLPTLSSVRGQYIQASHSHLYYAFRQYAHAGNGELSRRMPRENSR